MKDLYHEILKTIEQGGKGAVATIISRTGSAPRAVGAKYLIREDGSTTGSVGGGCVEAEVWQKAQEVIEKGAKAILHFSLSAEQLAEGGLICGGNVSILIEPLERDDLEIYQEVVRVRQRGGSLALVTLLSLEGDVSKSGRSKMIVYPTSETLGPWAGDPGIIRRVTEELPRLFKENRIERRMWPVAGQAPCGSQAEVLIEPVCSQPTVYLFGAGHVSEQIAPLARKVQFKVVVLDDREMFANRERFPDADEIVLSPFETCFDQLSIDESSFIIIVTRGHLYDGFVLEQAVKTKARYIGMIGSKKKIHILYQNLMKKGIPRETLDQVHAPIGLEIHSETPEEIAVSIVAQLIQVRGEPV